MLLNLDSFKILFTFFSLYLLVRIPNSLVVSISQGTGESLEGIHLESVIMVTGKVQQRPDGLANMVSFNAHCTATCTPSYMYLPAHRIRGVMAERIRAPNSSSDDSVSRS